MCVDGSRVAVCEGAQVLCRPHVMHRVGPRTEAGDVCEVERLRRRVACVDDENVRALDRCPRVELGRRGSRRRRSGRERSCRCSDGGVLVESEQLSVRDDVELRRVQPAKLLEECEARQCTAAVLSGMLGVHPCLAEWDS